MIRRDFEVLDIAVQQTPLLPELGLVYLDAPTITKDRALAALAEKLRTVGDYEYVEPNYCVYLEQGSLEDPKADEQWALDHIRAPAVWETETPGSTDVVVAVIDSGIELIDPEFEGRLVPGWNFVSGNGDPADDFGHGTQMSGVIGAVHLNGECIKGLNQQVSLMPLKVSQQDTGYVGDVIAAIDFAIDKKVDVINLSWSTYASFSFLEALERAGKAQIVVAAAAGHGGARVDLNDNPSYPCSFKLSNVICVTATTEDDEIEPDFSTWGDETVHLGAPGHKIVGPLLGSDCVARSGPSLAAPHVSGVVALIRAKCPNAKADEIVKRIRDGGVLASPLVGKTIWGKRLDALGALSPACQAAPE